MKEKTEKRLSLYIEGFLLLFVAGIVSLLFFMGSRLILDQQIDWYYEKQDGVRANNKSYISNLQEYVTEQNVASDDYEKLDAWIQENRLIYIQIKKDGRRVYSSDFDVAAMRSRDYDISPYPAERYYNIRFSDGTAQVFIMGMYSYKAYMIALVLEIIASFLLFFAIAIWGIRRKILYLNELNRDLKILEGGNLEYQVHVDGTDEIAELAEGINDMKTSFRKQIEEVEDLTRTNHRMITEISHDLRTPLTSVLLYAEILQNGKCSSDEQRDEYLGKIVKKIQHMKELSDKLLEYSASTPEETCVTGRFVPLRAGLYDELSDLCRCLEEQGLNVTASLTWENSQIFLHEEYLVRILDNISSNILKYADRQEPVLIWNEYAPGQMSIVFENFCADQNSRQEGYHIGLRNVRRMLRNMEGDCEVTQTEERFRTRLIFRCRSANPDADRPAEAANTSKASPAPCLHGNTESAPPAPFLHGNTIKEG